MQVTAYIGCYISSSRVGRSPLYERAANRAVPRNNRGHETSHGQCQASMQGSMTKRRRQLAHTGVTGSAIANMINLHRGKQTVDPIKSTGPTWQSPAHSVVSVLDASLPVVSADSYSESCSKTFTQLSSS